MAECLVPGEKAGKEKGERTQEVGGADICNIPVESTHKGVNYCWKDVIQA